MDPCPRGVPAALPAVQGTIRETDEDADHFDGVAYALSWWDKERLDQLERRAYKQKKVQIEIEGILTDAFTYVPLPPGSNEATKSPGSWIYYVVEGAQQNEMDELLAELRSVGRLTNTDAVRLPAVS